MKNEKSFLRAREVADLCNVGHSTVTHWIRQRKLQATQSGNRYLISRLGLIQFLQSTGKPVPLALTHENPEKLILRSLQSCWDFWQHQEHGKNCKSCIVQRNRLSICFVAKENDFLGCDTTCTQCDFYKKIFLPRFQFIHGLETPAVVFKDLVILGGNKAWERLCGLNENTSAGLRLDQLLDSESLKGVISDQNHRLLAEPVAPSREIRLQHQHRGWLNICIYIFAINSAEGIFLLLAGLTNRK